MFVYLDILFILNKIEKFDNYYPINHELNIHFEVLW